MESSSSSSSFAIPSLLLDSELEQEQENLDKINGLSVDLYKFQKKAVSWMLRREGFKGQNVPSVDSFLQLIGDWYFDIRTGYCYLKKDIFTNINETNGGLLADEMGLGKSVMVLSLILLNKYPELNKQNHFERNSKPIAIKTTLIVCPSSLLNQWKQEVSSKAPGISFSSYEGKNCLDGEEVGDLAEAFSNHDVVLTTYAVLGREMHAAKPGRDGPRRKERKVERRSSPLMHVHWHRIVLDEAQMVESSTSNPAEVASMLYRTFSWGCTGTPCPRTGTISDMRGIFKFLKFDLLEWNHLSKLPDSFLPALLAPVVHRNSKSNCMSELVIPFQKDESFFVQFSSIEEQFYEDLMEQSLEDIGPVPQFPDLSLLESEKERRKAYENYHQSISIRHSKMNRWFLRLRQTCCHPQISTQSKQELGGRKRLDTMSDVLDAMIIRAISVIQSTERSLVSNLIEKGQLFENSNMYSEAISVYKSQLPTCSKFIKALEDEYQALKEKYGRHGGKENEEEDEEGLQSEGLSRCKLNLNLWRLLEHRLVFYIASCFFVLKITNDEDKMYKRAAELREKILEEYSVSFCKARDELSTAFFLHYQDFSELEPVALFGEVIFEEVRILEKDLSEQMYFIKSWCRKLYETLQSPLDGNGETGGEFERGIEIQNISKSYHDELEQLIKRRFEMLNSDAKSLPQCDHCQRTMTGKGILTSCSHKLCQNLVLCPVCKEKFDFDIFNPAEVKIKRPLVESVTQKHLFSKVSHLKLGAKQSYKALIGRLKAVSSRSAENSPAKIAIQHMQEQLKMQLKDVIVIKDKILPMFTTLHNTRERYYTQLNSISDTVKIIDFGDRINGNELHKELDEKRSNLNTKLSKDLGRKRYLINLRNNQDKQDGSVENERQCVVCRDSFLKGFLTECGHVTCDACTSKWTKLKRKCPTCNSTVIPSTLATISFHVPQSIPAGQERTEEKRHKLIECIKLMKSYGTKIDMICKHILVLIEEDPQSKVLVFSQWEEMLSIVGESLKSEGIGYIGLDGRGFRKHYGDFRKSRNESLSLFKDLDSEISVLMLHSKSQSSGLNLTEASHVFLVEPLLNQGLEQQAIGRIHRIGQSNATYVCRYLVEGSIEMYLQTARIEDGGGEAIPVSSRTGEFVSSDLLGNKKRKLVISSSDSEDNLYTNITKVSSCQTELQSDAIEMELDTISIKNIPKVCSNVSKHLLIDKFPPLKTGELAIHKNKIFQVRMWLESLDGTPKILLLSGPAGAGKSAVVLALSKELGLELDEFENSINQNVFNSLEPQHDTAEYNPLSEQLIQKIQGISSSHCLKLQFSCTNTIKHDQQFKKQSLLLLEDLPSSNLLRSAPVQSAFRSYVSSATSSAAIIIILSDSTANGAKSNEIIISKRNVLPIDVFLSKNFYEIKFNPIAKTLLVKGITRIADKEANDNPSFKRPSKQYLDSLATSCQGDIRCAITHLQFLSIPSKHLNNADAIIEGDVSVSLFSLLGKILYNKRKDTFLNVENQLCSSLISMKRPELDFNPEELFNNLQMEVGLFSLFLNQNYTSHCNTLREAAFASEYLSLSDLYLGVYEHNSQLEGYSSSVAMRGILFSWNWGAETKIGSFKAFAKSEYWSCIKKRKESEIRWIEEFLIPKLKYYLTLDIRPEGFIASAHSLSLNDVFCEWLPYLKLTARSSQDIQFGKLISELGSFKDYTNLSYFQEKDDEHQHSQEPRSVSRFLQEEENKNLFLQKLKSMKQNLLLVDDDIED